MKRLTLILALLFASQAAFAGVAFFKYQRNSGMNVICVYDYMGSEYVITIPAPALCPLTIEV